MRQQGVFNTNGENENGEVEQHVVQYTVYYVLAPIKYDRDPFMFISFTVDGNAEDASAFADSVYASAQKIN